MRNARDDSFSQVQPAADEALLIVGHGKAGLLKGGGHLLHGEEAQLVPFGEVMDFAMLGETIATFLRIRYNDLNP